MFETKVFLIIFSHFFMLVGSSWINENATNNPLFEDDIDGVTLMSEIQSNGTQYFEAPHSFTVKPWPQGIVPYVISDVYFDDFQIEFIEAIIREINTLTCVKFIPRTTEENYIQIRFTSLTCQSKIGYKNEGRQIVFLNNHCMRRNDILHELMHVLGFFHEHNRPDRDNYVEIKWENIVVDKEKNFRIVNFYKPDYYHKVYTNTMYDFLSVMHYPSHGSSKNNKETITPRNKSVKIKANGLSEFDVLKIIRLYNCSTNVEEKDKHNSQRATELQTNSTLSTTESIRVKKKSTKAIVYGHGMYYNHGQYLIRRELQNNTERPLLHLVGQVVVDMDYDCRGGKLFWIDRNSRSIRSANVDGSSATVLLDGLKDPETIAVDWASKNIYYTDSLLKIIGVLSMDGMYNYTLVRGGFSRILGLAIDLVDKKLYYSNYYTPKPLIARMNLDGTNNESFVFDNISGPRDLVILHHRRQLCWFDDIKKTLECVGLNGVGRRVVHHLPQYPIGLTIQNEETFFSIHAFRQEFYSVSIYGNNFTSYKPSVDSGHLLSGIVALSDDCPPGDSPCSRNNGGCKYICLPGTGNSRTCACPDNWRNHADT